MLTTITLTCGHTLLFRDPPGRRQVVWCPKCSKERTVPAPCPTGCRCKRHTNSGTHGPRTCKPGCRCALHTRHGRRTCKPGCRCTRHPGTPRYDPRKGVPRATVQTP